MTFHQTLAEWSQWIWPRLANHLWQTTLFVLLAWITALLLGRLTARVRYLVWMIALIKFLLPLVLLIPAFERLGLDLSRPGPASQTGNGIISQIAQPVFPIAVEPEDSAGLAIIDSAKSSTDAPATIQDKHREIFCLLSLFWGLGAAVFLGRWLIRRWRFTLVLRDGAEVSAGREAEAFNRAKSRLLPGRQIKLVMVPGLRELGVWRIWRPVVVLPAGLAEQLSDQELEAVTMHELVHVMRSDNLMSTVQMVLCALFWFHPLIWLIDRRLLTEREVICDADVIRYGGDAQIYAASLWKVAQYGFGWNFAGISSAAGSNLARRIKLMLDVKFRTTLSPLGRTMAGTAICGLIVFALVLAIFTHSEARAARLQAALWPERLPILTMPTPVGPRLVAAPTPSASGLSIPTAVTEANATQSTVESTQDQRPMLLPLGSNTGNPTVENKQDKEPPVRRPVQFENDPQIPVFTTEAHVEVGEPFDITLRFNPFNKPPRMMRDLKFTIKLVNQSAQPLSDLSLAVLSPLFSQTGTGFYGKSTNLEVNEAVEVSWGSTVDDREDVSDLVSSMQLKVLKVSSEQDPSSSEFPQLLGFGFGRMKRGMLLVKIMFHELRRSGLNSDQPVSGGSTRFYSDNRGTNKPAQTSDEPNRLISASPSQNYPDRDHMSDVMESVQEMSAAVRPTITYKEKAEYTPEARAHGVQGTVVLNVVFDKDGTLRVIRVVRGLPDGLTGQAIKAAQKIRFDPAVKDGAPVNARGNLEFTFNLD